MSLRDQHKATWTYKDEMLRIVWDGRPSHGYSNFKIIWVSKPENKFYFNCVESGWDWRIGWTMIDQD